MATKTQTSGDIVSVMAVQVQIKKLILRDLTAGTSEARTKAAVRKIIDDFCKGIKNTSYREKARAALVRSFAKWYREAASINAALPLLVLAAYRNAPAKVIQAAQQKVAALPESITSRIEDLTPHYERGREYHDSDYRKRLKAAYARYYAKYADDEAKYSRRVSLRNLAEVETRFEENRGMLDSLRQEGVRLVWASSHADASERCTPWQGKLYSLDGTYGSEDGNTYQPIENAINVIDKYGNINGLFGYSCRHRLIPYTPKSRPPRDYTAEEMQRERKIDQRQRQMERTVRNWKMRGHILKGINNEASARAFEIAREWARKYEKFSLNNGRAFYRERITVMREEYEL